MHRNYTTFISFKIKIEYFITIAGIMVFPLTKADNSSRLFSQFILSSFAASSFFDACIECEYS